MNFLQKIIEEREIMELFYSPEKEPKILIDGDDCSRAICPYNRHATHINHKRELWITPARDCRKCSICIGDLSYRIWSDTHSVRGSLEILNEKRQGLEFKEAVFSHLREERKRLKEDLDLVKQIKF